MGLFTSADKVRYKLIKEEACEAAFTVDVPAADVGAEAHNALLRVQGRAKLPGFRPGKAPLDLVRRQFADHLREDVLEHFMRKLVPEALRELRLRPVAAPTVTDVSFEAGKPLQFKVRVEVPPKVSPKDYVSMKVSRKTYPATDEAVGARLFEIREAHARLVAAAEESLGKAHYAVIDYAASRDGKPMSKANGANELVDMSSDQTVPGLTEGLLGMRRGETKTIPVKIDKADAQLAVTVKEIKTKVLPELDAEFAKDMGFETLDELTAKLREVIADEGRSKTEREVSLQLEEALLKANRIPVPPSLVEAQLEHMMERLQKQLLGGRGELPAKQLEELRAKFRPQAEDQVRVSFLLPAIAEREKLEVKDSDLQAELEESLRAAESEAKKEDIRRMFERRKDEILGMLRDRKTMAFLREKAHIADVTDAE